MIIKFISLFPYNHNFLNFIHLQMLLKYTLYIYIYILFSISCLLSALHHKLQWRNEQVASMLRRSIQWLLFGFVDKEQSRSTALWSQNVFHIVSLFIAFLHLPHIKIKCRSVDTVPNYCRSGDAWRCLNGVSQPHMSAESYWHCIIVNTCQLEATAGKIVYVS